VAERTRLRIQAEARRLGYVANHAARQLAQGRFGRHRRAVERVGFVLFGRHEPLRGAYLAILAGVEQEVAGHGGTLLFMREFSERPRARFVELSRSGAVDGLALVGAVDDAALRKAGRTGLPFVVMGDHHGSSPVHQATADFPEMGRLAVRQLVARGHRRIGFVGATMRYVYQQEIRAGVRAALEESGLPAGAEWIQSHGAGENLMTPLRRLLALRPRPTALILGEPKEAGHLLALLSGLGLKAPDDISLLSCEESDSLAVAPGVAHVDASMMEVGAAGAALLREVAAAPDCPVRRVLAAPRFVEGGSVRKRGR
jgi:LacI family transcriptional regulator